jgi:hypothetical protein
MNGKKTGGRKKGTPNKTTSQVGVTFEDLGGPNGSKYAEVLHNIAVGSHSDVHARLKALSLIAPYVWGRPVEKHEISGTDGGPVRVVHEHHAA